MKGTLSERRLLRALIREVLGGLNSMGKDGVAGNVYGDTTRTGHDHGNILDDEADNDTRRKRAACCLITREDGKVLAVSRRDDTTMFGMPGGKVEPGEELDAAAKRETMEETGLEVTDLSPVFSHAEDDGYETTTFVAKAVGNIETEEEGVVRWIDIKVLLDPETSPFSSYNSLLFKQLGRIR